MHYLGPFFVQNVKKINRGGPQLWGHIMFRPSCSQHDPFSLRKSIVWQNHSHDSHICLGLFLSCYSGSRVIRMCHFWIQNDPFAQNDNFFFFFFRKTINTILMYLFVPFIMQKLKKILKKTSELWGHFIWGKTKTFSEKPLI